MEPEPSVTFLTLLVVLFSNGLVCGEPAMENEDLQNTLIERLDDIQSQLIEVTNSMRALDVDISKALVTCLGIHTDLCEALNGEVKTSGGLRSRWVLEKRSVSVDPELERYKSLFRELGRKQAMVNHLLGVFRGANSVLRNERKRTCNLNLGFHCQTEEISNFADMYDYLSSAHSPGKKRAVRRAR